MRWTLLLLIGARLDAQSEMPVGIMRGEAVNTRVFIRGPRFRRECRSVSSIVGLAESGPVGVAY
jgi:hypothetical protein